MGSLLKVIQINYIFSRKHSQPYLKPRSFTRIPRDFHMIWLFQANPPINLKFNYRIYNLLCAKYINRKLIQVREWNGMKLNILLEYNQNKTTLISYLLYSASHFRVTEDQQIFVLHHFFRDLSHLSPMEVFGFTYIMSLLNADAPIPVSSTITSFLCTSAG